MPFCTSCGHEVVASAGFCGYCGRPQASRARYGAPTPVAGPFDNISPRAASICCYIPLFGVIPAIIILASQRFRHHSRVRFDAFQSVYLFVAYLIASTALPIVLLGLPGWGPEHELIGLVKFAILICWIVLLVKASQGQQLHLPVIGDLAARSTNEQL